LLWFFILLTVLTTATLVPDGWFNDKWTYTESNKVPKGTKTPQNWKDVFPMCNPSNPDPDYPGQSPINIDTGEVFVRNDGILPLIFSERDQEIQYKGNISNIGSTLSFVPSKEGDAYFNTSSGTRYVFDRAQIHWHKKYNHHGTEHTVNGQGEAVEVQLIHRKDKFFELAQAFNDPHVGNIAIVAIRYTVAPTETTQTEAPAIDRFITFANDEDFEKVHYMNVDGKVEVFDFYVYDLIGTALSLENLPMFHYTGSLTTPGCDAIVDWFIVQQTVTISQGEMQQLRRISFLTKEQEEKGTLGFDIDSNCRPAFPSKGRNVIAWPRIVDPNMTSDSMPTNSDGDSGSAKKGLSTAAIIGISAGSAVAAATVVTAVVIIMKKKKNTGYESINA